MTIKMKSICIIPARGGSKRIPRKNILPLNGIPLISYSIRSVLEANVFDQVIVSTEDKEIAQIAIAEGVVVDTRPKDYSGDKITKVQVVKEFLERTNAINEYDLIATVLPTCPFRTKDDIENAYQLFINQNEKKFLVGVVEYDFPIQLALKKTDENIVKMLSAENYKTTRSQNIEKRYHPNGAIYLATIEAFLKKGTFFNEEMLAYEMPAERSFDIDYPYQFEIAEMRMKQLYNN